MKQQRLIYVQLALVGSLRAEELRDIKDLVASSHCHDILQDNFVITFISIALGKDFLTKKIIISIHHLCCWFKTTYIHFHSPSWKK